MANLIMTNWYIEDRIPYINLGSAGENNARTITIQVDELIDGAEYYMDIGSENGENLPNTQLMTPKTVTTPSGEEINILYFKPLTSFLGKDGVKLLQVRCVYINDEDEKVVQESNVFHGVVDKNSGFVYKYDISVFEQYINRIKRMIEHINGGGSGEGDMLKSVYDKNNNNIVDNSEKVNHALTINYDDTTYTFNGSSDVELTIVPTTPITPLNNIIDGNDGAIIENAVSDTTLDIDTETYYIKANTANDYAHVEGRGYISTTEANAKPNRASGISSHAEGNGGIVASGIGAHAEGCTEHGTNTITASGKGAHAEGYIGSSDIAITASGDGSHAEGVSTQASGKGSHAEGDGTGAIGIASHAEGIQTVAIGNYSHTEGNRTTAQNTAHAEGNNTTANGAYSHSQGNGTIAQGMCQTVLGKYNISQGTTDAINNTDYAIILGNGEDSSHQSNAIGIKWNGNIVLANGKEVTPDELCSQIVHFNQVELNSLTDNTLNLEPNNCYLVVDSNSSDGSSVSQLSITFDSATALYTLGYTIPDYHFMFFSGMTATQLILPNDVGVPSDFTISPMTLYDIKINPYIYTLTYTSRALN